MPPRGTLGLQAGECPEVKDKLGRLAQDTRRSRSFLANEAVEAYVSRELEIIDGIQRGLADVTAGRVVSHEAAIEELRVIHTARDWPTGQWPKV